MSSNLTDAAACRAPAFGDAMAPQDDLHHRLRRRALLSGAVAGLGLLGVYFGLLGAANSLSYAAGQFLRLWMWMAPLVAGFALQAGLFTYARGAGRSGAHLHSGGVVASGGASTLSMVACCAHHLTEVLPFLGLAGAGLFLGQYQSLFLLLGVLSNAVGTVYLLSLFGRHRLYAGRSATIARLLGLPWRRVLPAVVAAAVATFLAVVLAEFV
jgi:hypothetical protein